MEVYKVMLTNYHWGDSYLDENEDEVQIFVDEQLAKDFLVNIVKNTDPARLLYSPHHFKPKKVCGAAFSKIEWNEDKTELFIKWFRKRDYESELDEDGEMRSRYSIASVTVSTAPIK